MATVLCLPACPAIWTGEAEVRTDAAAIRIPRLPTAVANTLLILGVALALAVLLCSDIEMSIRT
jgi:hypothetical protein